MPSRPFPPARRTVPAALFALAVAAGGAAGAEPPLAPAADSATETLTWDACVREADAGNASLREARLRLDAAVDRRDQAMGGFLPRLSASVGHSDGGTAPPWFRPMSNTEFSASLSLSWSVFSGFGTTADTLAAFAAVRSARAQLAAASADVRLALRQAFVNLLFAQENFRVLSDIAMRRRANRDLVRLRYEAGREDKGSALRAAADSRAADYDLAAAGRSLVLARGQLAVVLGRDRPGLLAASGDWATADPPADPDLAALALATPGVRQAQADADSAHASLLGARSPFWPSVDLDAGLAQNGYRWPFDLNRSWSVGGSVSWNLFNGGRDWFGWRAARASAAVSDEALARTRRETRQSLQGSLFDFANAAENVQVRAQFLDAARTRAQIGRAQYANGTLGYVDWDLIENDLVDAERQDVAARRDALLSAASWDRALGVTLVP